MRVLAAMMKHETNTFSPVGTDLARFEAWGLHRGEAVIAACGGTNRPLAGGGNDAFHRSKTDIRPDIEPAFRVYALLI